MTIYLHTTSFHALPSLEISSPQNVVKTLHHKITELGYKVFGRLQEGFFLGKLHLTADNSLSCFYALRIPFGFAMLVYRGIHKASAAECIARVLQLLSDIGHAVLIAAHHKLVDLAKLAASFGKLRVIGKLALIPLRSVVNIAFGLANFFFGIDALIRLAKGNLTRREEACAWLDLAAAVAQVAIMIILLCCTGGFPAVIALGLVSGAFTCLSYGIHYWPLLVKYCTAIRHKICVRKKQPAAAL